MIYINKAFENIFTSLINFSKKSNFYILIEN